MRQTIAERLTCMRGRPLLACAPRSGEVPARVDRNDPDAREVLIASRGRDGYAVLAVLTRA